MTDLSNFLVLPQSCPCCQKPLKLFMQVLDGTLWQAQSGGFNQLIFEPYFTKDTKRSSQDYFQLTATNNQYDFDFTTSSLYQHSKTWQLFFSVACEGSRPLKNPATPIIPLTLIKYVIIVPRHFWSS